MSVPDASGCNARTRANSGYGIAVEKHTIVYFPCREMFHLSALDRPGSFPRKI